MSARIGDLVKLNGPILIALRGIIAVHRDVDAADSEPTEIVLEGGARIRVSRLEGEFVRHEWEFWHAAAKELARPQTKKVAGKDTVATEITVLDSILSYSNIKTSDVRNRNDHLRYERNGRKFELRVALLEEDA